MKRRLLGIVLFCVAFTTGFLLSPIRFDGAYMFHGVSVDGGRSWGRSYRSTYFILVAHQHEQYETAERAKEVFRKRISRYDVLEQGDDRAVVYLEYSPTRFKGYCIYRLENIELHVIWSSSLWQALEFEKQKYK